MLTVDFPDYEQRPNHYDCFSAIAFQSRYYFALLVLNGSANKCPAADFGGLFPSGEAKIEESLVGFL